MQKHTLFISVTIAGMILTGMPKLYAQGGYINVGLGYGMSAASTSFEKSITTSTSGGFKYETVKGSLGKGLQVGVTPGFMVNKNWGVELAIHYLMGGKIKSTSIYDATGNSNGSFTDIYKARMLRIIPTMVLTSGEGMVKPYAKVGLALGILGRLTNTYSDTYGMWNTQQTNMCSGRMAIGFASALGANIGSGKMSFFAELGMINQAWAPKKAVLTKTTVNGVDQLGSMNTSQKETVFVDSYDNSSMNASEPSKSTKKYFPMSSVGINIGMHIGFGK